LSLLSHLDCRAPLRQRLPQALILIGLWPAEDAVLTDKQLRAAIGADFYTTSLREAVNICVEAATQKSAAAK
jgi:hypothetical protein